MVLRVEAQGVLGSIAYARPIGIRGCCLGFVEEPLDLPLDAVAMHPAAPCDNMRGNMKQPLQMKAS